MGIKQSLKQVIPAAGWTVLRKTYSGLTHLPDLPGVYFHPWRRESMARLAEFKDIHKGKRAIIIGNGPSLKQTDLTKLKEEFTFGLNRIYLLTQFFGAVPGELLDAARSLVLSHLRFVVHIARGVLDRGELQAKKGNSPGRTTSCGGDLCMPICGPTTCREVRNVLCPPPHHRPECRPELSWSSMLSKSISERRATGLNVNGDGQP